jgi:hypothetical protein
MGLCTSKNEKTDIAETDMMKTDMMKTDNFSTAPVSAPPSEYRLPSDQTIRLAAKLAIEQDKPIMMDYWKASLNKTCVIDVRENKEKFLVKSDEEYTSPIVKTYKVDTEYVIETENTIYLVCVRIPTKRIS